MSFTPAEAQYLNDYLTLCEEAEKDATRLVEHPKEDESGNPIEANDYGDYVMEEGDLPGKLQALNVKAKAFGVRAALSERTSLRSSLCAKRSLGGLRGAK